MSGFGAGRRVDLARIVVICLLLVSVAYALGLLRQSLSTTGVVPPMSDNDRRDVVRHRTRHVVDVFLDDVNRRAPITFAVADEGAGLEIVGDYDWEMFQTEYAESIGPARVSWSHDGERQAAPVWTVVVRVWAGAEPASVVDSHCRWTVDGFEWSVRCAVIDTNARDGKIDRLLEFEMDAFLLGWIARSSHARFRCNGHEHQIGEGDRSVLQAVVRSLLLGGS